MQLIESQVVHSASDLVGFLACRHLTGLERASLEGHVERPVRNDPVLDRLSRRGFEHEEQLLQRFRDEGRSITTIEKPEYGDAAQLTQRRDETIAAMQSGADVIYQAVLFDGWRLGYADFLVRVDEPSDLGDWSYETWDAKLARQAKAGAVLQLCFYSDLLARILGRPPESMHLALGGLQREVVSYRYTDYAAYYRTVAHEFEASLPGPAFPIETKPEPVEHCSLCRWSVYCRDQWRKEDDLALVANLASGHRRALIGAGTDTRHALAAADATASPDGVGKAVFPRLREQARIQVEGEVAGQVLSERIPPQRDRDGELLTDRGLAMLPEPSAADLFFDIEGDPFFSSSELEGIEYLFGVLEPGKIDAAGSAMFHASWSIDDEAVTPSAERRAFEAFIDLVMERLAADPNLHIFHYAPYEPSAIKRLAARHGTREHEVDQLLRSRVFVDLYRAVRQGIRASVESYSIKKLEPLYGFDREVELRDANSSIVEFENWLELSETKEHDRAKILADIEAYNRDDCVSTYRLRDWLEGQRVALESDLGEFLPRPDAIAIEERQDTRNSKRSRPSPMTWSRRYPRMPQNDRTPNRPPGSWRSSSTGTGARTSRSGGATSTSGTNSPTKSVSAKSMHLQG